MDFPKSIPVLQLEAQNPEYNPRTIARARALYFAGSEFEALKDQFLYKRALEKSGKPAGQGLREARMQSAVYTPHIMGQVNFLTASIFQNNPCFAFEGPDNRVAYYNQLNATVPELVQTRLLDMVLHGRGFLTLEFPEIDGEFSDLEAQRGAGALDASLEGIDYCTVWDWERKGCELAWLKTRNCDLFRPNPWSEPTEERYTWTFITGDTIAEYSATRSLDKSRQDYQEYGAWVKEAKGKLEETETIDGLPITEVALPNGFCLMGSLAPLLVNLFNREASEDYALDASAFAMLVLKTEQKFSEVFGSEAAVLKLMPQDGFGWSSPQGVVYQELRASAEKKVKAIEKLIHAAAQDLASFDQHAASGAAKAKDFGPIAMMLLYYASALKRGLQNRIDHLIRLRGEQNSVKAKVMGLDDFDLESLSDKMGFATSFFALPGVPPTARKEVISDLCVTALPDADSETKKKIQEEIEAGVEVPVTDSAVAESSADSNGNAASSASSSSGSSTISSAAKSVASTVASSGMATIGDKGPPIEVQTKLKQIDPSRVNPQHGSNDDFRGDLVEKMKAEGYDQSKPILAVEIPDMHADGGSIFKSLDGHHRSGAAKILKLKRIPAYVIKYADWQKLTDAFPFDPRNLGSLDDHIRLPDGRLYSEVREKNDHDNGTMVAVSSSAVSSK